MATPIPLVSERFGEAGHNIRRPEIQQSYYSSKHFFIAYFKEFVLMQNSCMFQIDLPLNNFLSNNLILEFELIQHNEQDGATEEMVAEKIVCIQKLRINRPGKGIQQYFPVMFTEWYFSILKVIVNTSLTNVIYKMAPAALLDTHVTTGVGSPTTSPKVSRSFSTGRASSPVLGSPKQQTLQQVTAPPSDDEMDTIMNSRYQEIQSYLVETYCRLVTRYKKLVPLLKQSQAATLGDAVNVSPLNIPPLQIWQWKSSLVSVVDAPAAASHRRRNYMPSFGPVLSDSSDSDDEEVGNLAEINSNSTSSYNSFGSSTSAFSSISSNGSTCSDGSPLQADTTTNAPTQTISPSSSRNNLNDSTDDSIEVPIWCRIIGNFQKMSDQISSLWEAYTKIFNMTCREHCFKSALQFENKCIERWDHRLQRMTLHISDLHDLLLVDTSPPTSQYIASNFAFKPFKLEIVPVKIDTVYDAMPVFFEQRIKFHQAPTIPVQETPAVEVAAVTQRAIAGSAEEVEQITDELNQKHLSNTKKYMLNITNSPGRHLFIFVHGLSGNSYDLRAFKNYFSIHFHSALYLICSSIEENTLDDIQQLGEKIATEVSDSEQDGYVPFHSARVELPKESLKDKFSSQKSTLRSMLQNILEPIKARGSDYAPNQQPIESIIKLNVIFEAHKGVDGVIGRSAHIRMLDQPWFMQMFVQMYKSYWEQ
eukprot:gene8361-9821_t